MANIHLCRDSFGYFNASIFQLWTCSMCYYYLFPESIHLQPNWDKNDPQLVGINTTTDINIVPNINNPTNALNVCNFLDGLNCDRWKSCCQSAVKCCQQQLLTNYTAERRCGKRGNRIRYDTSCPDTWSGGYTSDDVKCPKTWDGFGCVEQTDAGTSKAIKCPDFIEYGFSSGYAQKTCTNNGTWWSDPTTNREWTDYTPCLNLKMYKSVVYVGVACCSLSLFFLIPAFFVFINTRHLRYQNRIRLHACLFLSFIMTCIGTILWDLLIYSDRLDNPSSSTRMHNNTTLCRILYIFNRYARTSNYFWMFCEGFYLHRLILHAFQVPRTLTWYYIIGWGGSSVPVIIYVVIRLHLGNYECWVKHIGPFEWIIYLPNLLSIVLNLIFLCSILRIVLSGLQSHPNEPSNYRRGLKALFFLVPLFGIQLFFVIYRPPAEKNYRFVYEIISKFIVDSQGALVSLVFCYMNTEVHSSLKTQFHSINIQLQLPCVELHGLPPNATRAEMRTIRPATNTNGYYKNNKNQKSVKIDNSTREYIFT